MSSDGVIFFLNHRFNQIHRWDVARQISLSNLLGTHTTSTMSVDPDGTTVYLAYELGRIDQFLIKARTHTRKFFAATRGLPQSLFAIDSYLFAIDQSDAGYRYSLFRRGTRRVVASADERPAARSIAWASGMERLYLLGHGASSADVHYVDIDTRTGALGQLHDSSHHDEDFVSKPIRVLPDESRVVVGSGSFFDSSDLSYVTSFGFSFHDIAFHDGLYYLALQMGQMGQLTQIKVLDSDFYEVCYVDLLAGGPQALFVFENELVAVTTGLTTTSTRVHVLPLDSLCTEPPSTSSSKANTTPESLWCRKCDGVCQGTVVSGSSLRTNRKMELFTARRWLYRVMSCRVRACAFGHALYVGPTYINEKFPHICRS